MENIEISSAEFDILKTLSKIIIFFYLLDPFDPDLVQPNSYYALREVEAASEMEQIQRFSIQQDAWDHIVAVMD